MRTPARLAVAMALVLAACSSSGGTKADGGKAGGDKKSDPLYSLSLMRQGSVMLQQGRYEAALEQFEAADRAAPGNATVHNMLGLCHLKLEDYDRALGEFNRALDIAPTFADARNNRGSVYLATEQYRMAEVDYVAVLADPTYPHRWQVHYNLGVVHLKQGRISAAEENFRRVVTSPEPIADAYLRLAEIAESRDELLVATNLLEEARLKFPNRLDIAIELGRLLIATGREDEGELQLKEVVAKASSAELADRARGLLQQD